MYGFYHALGDFFVNKKKKPKRMPGQVRILYTVSNLLFSPKSSVGKFKILCGNIELGKIVRC